MITLLPLFVVLSVGLWSGNIRRALVSGILAGACIATNFNLLEAGHLILSYILDNLELSLLTQGVLWEQGNNLFIFIFLVCIGVLVEQLRITKGTDALIQASRGHIYDRISTQKASMIFSLCLCIDDYLSILAVGSIMRPLADFYHLSRARLALFVDSLAAPLVIISPISSWAAAIIGFLAESGIQPHSGIDPLVYSSPYEIFFQIIPWMFYSLAIVFSMVMIMLKDISYGPLHNLEDKTIALSDERFNNLDSAPLLNFIVPMGSLLSLTFLTLLWNGDYWIMGGSRGMLEAIQNAPISKCLCVAGFSSASISLIYGIISRQLKSSSLLECISGGWRLMHPCIMVLLLAWTIGSLMRYELRTGEYFAQFFSSTIPTQLIPLIYFLLTTMTAFALGSSWASFAIFFPTTIPMLLTIYDLTPPVMPTELPLLIPSFAAILSGSVCGDHLSLISDTTALTVTSTACPHHEHFRSQWPMALPAVISSMLAFLIVGIFQIHSLSLRYLFVLIAVITLTLLLLSLFQKRLNEASS